MAARKKAATKKRTTTKKGPAVKRKAAAKPAKRVAKRAVAAKRATKPAAVAKAGPISVGRKPFTKSQFIMAITSQTGVARKEVVAILDTISKIIGAHVHKQGPEIFSWPGMFKIQVTKKPATKARQGINPFTGETMMFKAKPASRRIKIRALKQLKALAS